MNQKSSNRSNEDRKKQKLIKLFAMILVIVILASLSIVRTEFREDKLLSTHVSVQEAVSELQFTIYSKEEWDDFFKTYKEAYITREMVYDILTKVGRNEAILEDNKGNKIKMIFSEEDNYETENKITGYLLTSYEQRMSGMCSNAE